MDIYLFIYLFFCIPFGYKNKRDFYYLRTNQVVSRSETRTNGLVGLVTYVIRSNTPANTRVHLNVYRTT
jgi:hypothetical protein